MASFNSIDDDCILLILIRIALSSRISLRLICRRWKSLIDSQCRNVSALRLVSHTGKSNAFPIEYFTKVFCKVQHLNIKINYFWRPQRLTSIMQCWSSTITHLSIYNLPCEVPVNDQILYEPEWIQLNKMTKLESLHLSNMRWNQVIAPEYLSFVGQLKCLSLVGYDADALIPLIYSIGTDMRDLRLKIEYLRPDDRRFDLDGLEKAFEDNRQIISSVTRLRIYHPCKRDINSNVQFGELICTYFCSVTELDFVPAIPMERMLPHLASLSNLSKLKLLPNDTPDFTRFRDYVLKSVKYLILNVSHFDSNKLIHTMEKICAVIPITFPFLEELLIVVKKFNDFDDEEGEDGHDVEENVYINYNNTIHKLRRMARKMSFCKVRVEADPKKVTEFNKIGDWLVAMK